MQLKKDSDRRLNLPLPFFKSNKGKILLIFLIISLIVGVLYAFGELRPAVKKCNQMVYEATGVDIYHDYVIYVVCIEDYINGLRSNPERITIDIKNNDFQKLAYKREIALAQGILISSDEDYVPAKIR